MINGTLKKLITVAERHNSDIDVLKKELGSCVNQWNKEYKNVFILKEPDWYDNFGMVKIIISPLATTVKEEVDIVLNVNTKEIRVVADLPEVIDVYSYTLETAVKKKLKEVIRLSEKNNLKQNSN